MSPMPTPKPMLPVLGGLRGAGDEEHEALCRRCGVSCFFAIPVNGLPVVVDELHCKFLGRGEDGRYHCTVYERRFEVAPWCHSAEQALADGFLAQDCPYVRAAGKSGYKGKVRLGKGLMEKVMPALLAEVLRVGVPIGADPDAVLRLFASKGAHRYRQSEDGTRYLFEAVG